MLQRPRPAASLTGRGRGTQCLLHCPCPSTPKLITRRKAPTPLPQKTLLRQSARLPKVAGPKPQSQSIRAPPGRGRYPRPASSGKGSTGWQKISETEASGPRVGPSDPRPEQPQGPALLAGWHGGRATKEETKARTRQRWRSRWGNRTGPGSFWRRWKQGGSVRCSGRHCPGHTRGVPYRCPPLQKRKDRHREAGGERCQQHGVKPRAGGSPRMCPQTQAPRKSWWSSNSPHSSQDYSSCSGKVRRPLSWADRTHPSPRTLNLSPRTDGTKRMYTSSGARASASGSHTRRFSLHRACGWKPRRARAAECYTGAARQPARCPTGPRSRPWRAAGGRGLGWPGPGVTGGATTASERDRSSASASAAATPASRLRHNRVQPRPLWAARAVNKDALSLHSQIPTDLVKIQTKLHSEGSINPAHLLLSLT